MEDFNKVRNRIAGLKKEKAELAKNYNFLGNEIKRIVDEHGKAIQEFSEKAEAMSSKLAAAEERENSSEAAITSVKEALSNEISALEKRLGEQEKSLTRFKSELARTAGAAREVSSEIKQRRRLEKDFSSTFSAVSDKLAGVSKHIDNLEQQVTNSVETADNKFTSAISLVNRTLDEQSSLLKDHDSAINRLALSLQTLKKDIEAENERMSRVKESTRENSKKLELLGKLEAQIKHIEQVKAGLVKGVESLKAIENKMAALQQKTLDLDKKLTGADKFIEEKLLEKTDVLERQLEDRLKILETNIVQKNSEMFSQINADIAGVRKDMISARKYTDSVRAEHAETRKKLKLLENLRQRIRDVENLSKSLTKNLRAMDALKKDITVLRKDVDSSRIRMEDVDSAIEKKIDFNISSIKKDTAFNAAALARLDEELRKTGLDMNALKKDTTGAGRTITKISSDIANIRSRISELEKLQIKLGDLAETKQALTDAMEEKLQERIKFIEATFRQKAENIEASLNDKLKNISKDKDEIARNLSSLKSIRTDVTKMTERSRSFEKQFNELKSYVSSELAGLAGKVDSTRNEEGNKFSTAVKAFLNSRAELNKKISMLELRVSDSNKRISDFSKLVSRIDLLERKVDRLSERNREIRKDMESFERKDTGNEKVTVVDLGSAEDV